MSERVESFAEGVACRMDATGFRTVICLDEGGARQIRQGWKEWCQRLEDRGRATLLLDGESGEGLYEMLSQWSSQFQGEDETVASGLFDYLSMAMDMGGEASDVSEREALIVDAMVRIAEEVVQTRTAVIVVLRPEKLSKIDRRALSAMMQHFACDPLAEIDPDGVGASPLGFLWQGSPEELRGVEAEPAIAVDDQAEEIRRFLSQDHVVDQLLDTTRGDPGRLEALFGALPDTVTHLWSRRIEELTHSQRRLARYLAVANTALEVGFLDRLVDESVIGVVRGLCDKGVARRSMEGGVVKVGLASEEIATGVDDGIGDVERDEIHAVLATAAVECGAEDGAFVARHALAAGDEISGMRFGLPAARRLLRRGRWDQARSLLEQLRDVEEATREDRRKVLMLSLRLAEAKSAWRQALSFHLQLEPLLESSSEEIRARRRRATYLVKVGRLDEAESEFSELLEQDNGDVEERVRAMIGLADIGYQRGEQEQVTSWTQQAQRLLGDEVESRQELVVLCVSLQGKAALYRGELEQAWKCFEEAAGRARRIGLRGEESRAEINLGVVAVQQRRYEEARRRLESALEKAEMTAGTLRLNCWLNLGIVHQRRGQFGEALDNYARSLREAKRRGDQVAREVALHNLATLYQDMGAFDAARRLVANTANDGDEGYCDGSPQGGFASRWAAMTEAQILLKTEEFQQALDALRHAEHLLTLEQRLYGEEMRLRRAMTYLKLDRVDEAASLLEEFAESKSVQSPQVKSLYRAYRAALSRRRTEGPSGSEWRSIIGELESLGMFQDAVDLRMEWVADLEEREAESCWIIEQGVEDLRRRAKSVPRRFYEDYLAIPVHRRMLSKFHEANGGALPEEIRALVDRVERQASDQDCTGEKSGERHDAAYHRWRARYGDIVGEDPKILNVFQIVDRVAPSKTTVLLAGESGTGKELVAQAIHDKSDRKDAPFVRVNCAAFVEELLLSELFGHEKGAFTGAVQAKTGRFERADGGTIFLDEIGDISPKTQVALLRVLQQGTFERVGGTETLEVDVRVVAATNRDLEEMVQEGTFRLDLYYRLKGFLIELPPLRERRQDIPRLLRHFAAQYSQRGKVPEFSAQVMQFLAQYRWPGNVRELENFVQSVLLFSEGRCVEMGEITRFREFFSQGEMDESLPPVDLSVDVEEYIESPDQPEQHEVGAPEDALVEEVIADERSLALLKKRLEKKCIKAALRQTGGNITQAARILQMKRPRLSQIVNGDDELLALKEELVG